MNHVILTGRLTKDPEIRYIDSKKAVCSFTLAVDDGRDSEGRVSNDNVVICAKCAPTIIPAEEG